MYSYYYMCMKAENHAHELHATVGLQHALEL